MVPASFASFFVASTGAAAALVGLLFVAISIAPEHVLAETAPIERQTGASSAFTALFNAFFVSLVALIPATNVGGLALTMGLIGLTNTAGIAVKRVRRQHGWRAQARGGFLLLASFFVYAAQSWYSIALLRDYKDLGALFILTILIIVAYGIGLTRAWELLGGRRLGLTSWISLLLNLGASDPTDATRAHQPAQTAAPQEQVAHVATSPASPATTPGGHDA